MTRRPRTDLRAEDGFTIVELLTAMVIGAIVLFATLTVLDTTISLTTRVNTRVDTLQRGRNAMDLMIRDLRSQNCVNVLTNAATGATSMDDSLIGGSATSVTALAGTNNVPGTTAGVLDLATASGVATTSSAPTC